MHFKAFCQLFINKKRIFVDKLKNKRIFMTYYVLLQYNDTRFFASLKGFLIPDA